MSDHFETNAIHNQIERSVHKEFSVPLYLTSGYKFEDAEEMRALFAAEKEGNIYSRYSNPNTTDLIQKIASMEGTETGWATASGMSAVFATFMTFLSAGDHVISSRSVFGATHQLFTKFLPKWNISHSYAEITKPETWEAMIQANTKMIYVETPSNPGMDLIDIELLSEISKKHNLLLVVDNCFATPYVQQPVRFGADLVIHSATKFLDGQGRVLGGLIAGPKVLIDEIEAFARQTGPSMSPFNAWIISKSLETLAIRMDRHAENALALAKFLEGHEDVEKVKYPFLESHPQHAIARKQMRNGGGLVTFEIKGGLERGRAFMDSLKMISLVANLGDVKTLATHPASSTHSKLTEEERLEVGITSGLIRISAGHEHIDDITSDIEQAFVRSRAKVSVG